ncbi:hypothetical protein V1514DRAFT_328607 [Lipomyces japonicus]|uniref:uncharacterized protein n=1 Tax=Lipomyces japonicus TaxID=56871 RepID=UPI0034CFB33F
MLRNINVISSFAVVCVLGLLGQASAGWAETHMKDEHGIDQWDASSFFALHDSDNSKYWTKQDILTLYGIFNPVDPTGHRKEPITVDQQNQVYESILNLVDTDHDGSVSLQEWLEFNKNGGQLPDFGYGPGHHGDVEYEYEIHHWLKYHTQDENDESLNHPEDIEHEKLFHNLEEKSRHDEQNNIPLKFRIQ